MNCDWVGDLKTKIRNMNKSGHIREAFNKKKTIGQGTSEMGECYGTK